MAVRPTPDYSFTVPDNPGVLYAVAALGTAVAGGLFPLAIATLALLTTALSGRMPGTFYPGESLQFVLIGFVVGFVFATIAASCVFPIVGLLDWLASLERWRGALLSCAGGWCGFASVAALTHQQAHSGPLVLSFAALGLGQLGAGLAVRMLRRGKPDARLAHVEDASRLPLKQLFGITTAVAIAAATLASLPIAPHTLVAFAVALSCQVTLVAGYALIHHRWKARPAARPFPRVPRETIGATPLD